MDSQNESNISQILAIDFGKAKIGLALADTETKIAFAYKTIPNDKHLWNVLAGIVKEKRVKKIIIGLPDYATGEKPALVFGEKLKEKLNIEVVFQNEMFTTKMAQENIKARGEKNIARKDDAEAAKIILQDWLDRT
jgi:putative holliday junction resolvase